MLDQITHLIWQWPASTHLSGTGFRLEASSRTAAQPHASLSPQWRFPMTYHRPWSRLFRFCAAVGIAALSTAACSGTDASSEAKEKRPDTTSEEPARGVVGPAAANNLLDRYEKVNNKANKSQDAKLLSTVEGGNLFERSNADYEQFRNMSSKEKKEYETPFFYEDRQFFIPAGGTWFVVTARATESKKPSLLVFDKSGGSWKMTAALHSWEKKIPAIATNSVGLAKAVPTDAKSGSLKPDDIPAAYEDLWETGGKEAGKALSPSAPATQAKASYRDRDDKLGARGARTNFFRTQPKYTQSYSVQTKDGGVLAIVPLSHKQEVIVTRPGLQLNPDPDEALYNSTPRAVITSDFHGQALAHLPTTGKPKVSSVEYQMVDSH
ncbi:hypothetical protein ABZW18_00495 [Streptomyces sp. NPDC004647]|uniref:hypothetical protein n=1 Tax=Streptomyces sp. NPDC004647 TaxID=3154671 RepID=UPI0033A730E2